MPLQFDIRAILKSKAPKAKVPNFIIRYLERIVHVEQMNAFLRKYPDLKGYEFIDASLGPVAITSNKVEDPAICESLEKMLDMMEENEDIQEVYHNWDN